MLGMNRNFQDKLIPLPVNNSVSFPVAGPE
jgi:hypothetical protein